jgi:hypothetical protein
MPGWWARELGAVLQLREIPRTLRHRRPPAEPGPEPRLRHRAHPDLAPASIRSLSSGPQLVAALPSSTPAPGRSDMLRPRSIAPAATTVAALLTVALCLLGAVSTTAQP